MADLRISELQTLAGANLAAGDYMPLADVSASESRKITVTDFLGNAVTLLADDTIPSGKILFGSGTIPGTALETGTVPTGALAANAVSASKLADRSTVNLVSALPASGSFIGQLALDVSGSTVYCWDGSQWLSIKAAGSVNTVIGDSGGIVNISINQVGDSVTISTTLDDTTAAGQFLAGPSGSAGAASYRTIAPADLPTAATGAKGAVQVNGNGLAMNGDRIEIDNTVAANTAAYHVTQYDANGLITAGRAITGADLPAATASTLGVMFPGSGLAVTNEGELNHSNNITAGTHTKVTIDAQGHVTVGADLDAADIPEISTDKLTSGELPTDRIADDAVTGAKLANSSVTQFGGAASTEGVVTFPTAEFTGQYFFDSINGDLYLWDGNAWQAITITAGEIIYAGTFDASAGSGTGQIASLTTAGQAIGLTVGSALPAASAANNRYYLVVSVGGTITSGNAPNVALAAPDMILSNGSSWEEIDVSTSVTGATQASNITVTPAGGIQSTNVQAALEELDTEKIGAAGATITGELLIGTTGALAFEGSTDNAYETYLAVTDPTADRTITFPDRSGTVITSGDTGTVTNTMLAGSIALSKLANLTSGSIIVGSAGNVPTAVAVTGDVTISNAGVTAIAAGAVINADISASAAIAFSKLEALNSGSLLVGNASNVATAVTPTGDVTISNTGVTAIASGVIVNADINASAAIADTKLATISTAGKVSGAAITSGNISTSGSIATTSTLAVGQSSAAANTDLDLAGTYAQTVVTVSALDVDCSTGNYFIKTINANSTFTFSNVPASRAYSFTLELTHTSGTVTWPAAVKWPADTAPTLTAGKTHLFMFVTDDGGTRWRGAALVDYVN